MMIALASIVFTMTMAAATDAVLDCGDSAPWGVFRAELLSHEIDLVNRFQNLPDLQKAPGLSVIVANSNGSILNILEGISDMTEIPEKFDSGSDGSRSAIMEIKASLVKMMSESGINQFDLDTLGCGPVTVGGPSGYPSDGTLTCRCYNGDVVILSEASPSPKSGCVVLRCRCNDSADKTVVHLGDGIKNGYKCISALQ